MFGRAQLEGLRGSVKKAEGEGVNFCAFVSVPF